MDRKSFFRLLGRGAAAGLVSSAALTYGVPYLERSGAPKTPPPNSQDKLTVKLKDAKPGDWVSTQEILSQKISPEHTQQIWKSIQENKFGAREGIYVSKKYNQFFIFVQNNGEKANLPVGHIYITHSGAATFANPNKIVKKPGGKTGPAQTPETVSLITRRMQGNYKSGENNESMPFALFYNDQTGHAVHGNEKIQDDKLPYNDTSGCPNFSIPDITIAKNKLAEKRIRRPKQIVIVGE